MDVCAVCLGTLDGEKLTTALPGCRHCFHTACILAHFQYDARCPVCRGVPEGVQVRSREHDDAERGAWYVVVERDMDLDDREERLAWNRYRRRRRRCLNREPHLLHLFERLRRQRAETDHHADMACRAYHAACRNVWRTDPDVRTHMQAAARARRRAVRTDRILSTALEERIGEEP